MPAGPCSLDGGVVCTGSVALQWEGLSCGGRGLGLSSTLGVPYGLRAPGYASNFRRGGLFVTPRVGHHVLRRFVVAPSRFDLTVASRVVILLVQFDVGDALRVAVFGWRFISVPHSLRPASMRFCWQAVALVSAFSFVSSCI